MLNLGMVGCGGHASWSIFPSIRFADMRLVAVCDLDEDLARRNAEQFGAERLYGDAQVMLEKEDLDVVGVVGPPQMHHDVGLQVLASGRHLFIEKPPGRTLADARELQDAARAAGVQLMVGFMKRHALAYARAKQIMATPQFGQPRMLRLNYSHWKWEDLRNHLIFMSIHAFDLARFYLGDVTGGAIFKRRHGTSYVISLQLEHGSGAVSQIALSAFEPRVQESLELGGESTLIQVRNLTELRYLTPAPDLASALETDESMAQVWSPEFTLPLPGSNSLFLQGYAGQMKAFADAIANGRPVSPNIDDGVEAMRLVEAVEAAPPGTSLLSLPA